MVSDAAVIARAVARATDPVIASDVPANVLAVRFVTVADIASMTAENACRIGPPD
jgi:hypothetical protein